MKISIAAVAFALSLPPALADDNVLCVQRALATRGYDPGPLDGELGSRTRSAAQSLAAATRISLPVLTTGTAATWCQTLQPTGAIVIQRREPDPFRPRLCPSYVIDPDDPCF